MQYDGFINDTDTLYKFACSSRGLYEYFMEDNIDEIGTGWTARMIEERIQ